MKSFQIRQQQFLPVPLSEAWHFFSNPENLAEITPESMKFRIVENSHPDGMLEGQRIRYRIRILPGIWVHWLTRITEVRDRKSFTDEQVSGPYAVWKHRHHFRAVTGGVEMTDDVTYALPFGWLGEWTHALYVRSELKRIFAHRRSILERKFRKDSAAKSFSV